jgi:NH3-dependent NAD+ synthetase
MACWSLERKQSRRLWGRVLYKYGDGGVDLSPIADLMKSEVFLLGSYLKVPESILTASPTDGLFGDDRTDEDQLERPITNWNGQ